MLNYIIYHKDIGIFLQSKVQTLNYLPPTWYTVHFMILMALLN